MNEEQHTIYQSLIGALQWCVTLERIYIAVTVMMLHLGRVIFNA